MIKLPDLISNPFIDSLLGYLVCSHNNQLLFPEHMAPSGRHLNTYPEINQVNPPKYNAQPINPPEKRIRKVDLVRIAQEPTIDEQLAVTMSIKPKRNQVRKFALTFTCQLRSEKQSPETFPSIVFLMQKLGVSVLLELAKHS